MKLKKEFITRRVGEELIMISIGETDFNGMIRANTVAAFIIDCLKSETDADKIVSAIQEKYDVDAEKSYEDVLRIINKLRSVGAIEE